MACLARSVDDALFPFVGRRAIHLWNSFIHEAQIQAELGAVMNEVVQHHEPQRLIARLQDDGLSGGVDLSIRGLFSPECV